MPTPTGVATCLLMTMLGLASTGAAAGIDLPFVAVPDASVQAGATGATISPGGGGPLAEVSPSNAYTFALPAAEPGSVTPSAPGPSQAPNEAGARGDPDAMRARQALVGFLVIGLLFAAMVVAALVAALRDRPRRRSTG